MDQSARCLIRIAYNKLRKIQLHIAYLGIFIAICSPVAYAQLPSQEPDQIVAHLAFGGNFHVRSAKVDGVSTPSGKTSVMAGGAYQRQLTQHFYISGGLAYSRHTYTAHSSLAIDTPPSEITAQVELISVPLLARIDVGKFIFINAGPSVDFEVNRIENASHSRQSGIGISVGIGAQYQITNVALWANPFLKHHALIPFSDQRHPAKLNVAGLAVGVDYRF